MDALETRLPHGAERNLGLDLVRAMAILLVLVSHWASVLPTWFGWRVDKHFFLAGEIGVNLFFGLSGLLIGRILIDQARLDPSARNLGVFLVRRWMRTLPLYAVVLAIVLALARGLPRLGEMAIRFATLTQNLAAPAPPIFSVSWSLAVEEWFYLLFGVAAFVALRFVRAAWAIWLPVGVFLVAPTALRLFTPGFSFPSGMTQMVPFRLDAIAYGVAMAEFAGRGAGPFRRPWLSLAAGVGLIAAMWASYTPGGYRVSASGATALALLFTGVILGCVLLLPAATRLTRLPRPLAMAVRSVSAWSYSLYLIHLTLLADVAGGLVRRGWPPAAGVVVAIGGPFLFAYLSFRFFEAPILRRRPAHRRRPQSPAASPAAPAPAAVSR